MLETITRTLWGRVGCPPPYMTIVPLVCLSAAFTLIDIVYSILTLVTLNVNAAGGAVDVSGF